MKGLKQMLLQEEEHLSVIIERTKDSLTNAPEGKLRLSQSKKQVQYYRTKKNGRYNGSYIPKADYELARQLAQKDYDEKILACAEKRRKQIQRITADYKDDEIEQIFLKQHVQRQKMINPVEPTWEQKVQEWMEEKYDPLEFQEGTPVIYSDRGERVRSKTERTIADFLFHNQIPYKYECPLYLQGYGIVYPDFTILSRKKNKVVYWEHDGKMDDPTYAVNAIKKIQSYEDNGIVMGDNLILTFETSKTVLNNRTIKRILDEL